MKKSSKSKIHKLLLIILLVIIAMPQKNSKAANIVVYDAIQNPLPPSIPSLGYQATSTAEFGDHIQLANSNRTLSNVSITMVTWAYHATYPTMPIANWTHPITLNIYAVNPSTPGLPGALLATSTETFDIPWRPDPDNTGACSGTAWLALDGSCNNGYAFNITFDMSSLNVTLPNEIIVGVAYNTQTHGYAPIGTSGPFNSLNIGVEKSSSTIGVDVNTDTIYWNTTHAPFYSDNGVAGVGIFREDTNWSPYSLAVQIEADQIATTTTITSNTPTTSTAGDPVTVFYSVNAATGTPTGNVTISDGVDSCTGTVAAGTCTITLSTAGTRTLTATYSGDTYYYGSTGTTSYVVSAPKIAETSSDFALPQTGFAPNSYTEITSQIRKTYDSTSMTLTIPSLGVETSIVGVSKLGSNWDVSWLGNNVGWLENSAFPTWQGNTVITGHVWNNTNLPGIFVNIKELSYGDLITITNNQQTYTYEVIDNQLVGANDLQKVFASEEYDVITLLTCENFSDTSDAYLNRRMIKAILIGVE